MTKHKLALVADIVAHHAHIAMLPEHLTELVAATAQFLEPPVGQPSALQPKRKGRKRPARVAKAGSSVSPAFHGGAPDQGTRPAPAVHDGAAAPPSTAPARKRLTVADLAGGLAGARSQPDFAVSRAAVARPASALAAATPPEPVNTPRAEIAEIKTSGLSRSEALAQAERLFTRR